VFREIPWAALALLLAARVAIAQTGTLVGRVTNALTGAPVATAQLTVTGTPLAAQADADGRFRLPNVPITAREVRARGLGYQPATATFSLTTDATATVAIPMTASTIELDAVMVTGAVGDTRRRAVGHSVAVVNGREIVGRSAVVELLRGSKEFFRADTTTWTVVAMIGEGSNVVAHVERRCLTSKGAPYENDYLLRFDFDGGRIREAWEQTDTALAFDLFAVATDSAV